MKQIFENQLNQIWTKWLRTEWYFDKLRFDIDENFFNNPKTQDYCIESFLIEYEDKLSQRQKNFANHILQVMVEVTNHEYIDKTLLKQEPETYKRFQNPFNELMAESIKKNK